MKVNFHRIHLHRFMSFDDATISLEDRGYCLISGINENPKDAAKSNGSGKSTVFNAISYVLTGETLQGLKSNLSNIYFNDGCYVELDFEVNNDKYKLIRSRDDSTYGTNLKIYVNGEDKSGKGLRESQEIVDTYLPDLTSELIGSVILLGQGLPQKFTSNSPSGRKEVLEHLSKSDFMIQDLKERIEKRQIELNNKYTENNNDIISADSKLSVYNNQKQLKETEYQNYQKEVNYDSEIATLQAEYDSRLKEIDRTKEHFNEFDKAYKEKSDEVNKLYASMSEQKTAMERQHSATQLELNKKISEQRNLVRNLENDIAKLKSITDVCPTCGQKIPNVIKPDTSKQEADLIKLKEDLNTLVKEEEQDDRNYDEAVEQCENSWKESLRKVESEKSDLYLKTQMAEQTKVDLENKNNQLFSSIVNLNNLKNTFETNKKRVEDELKTLDTTIESLNKDKKEKESIEKNLSAHLDAITKMNTLIKRDFRGILLQDIITYIDSKMKEYASKIFNTDEISLALDGNNIDITFCGKDFENLSGGEQQRVDCITQFAIRDLLCKYLNFSSNILVLDEITDTLDSVSCDRVLNFITTELSGIESVFIISHHSDELQIPRDSEIVIRKDIHGVSTVLRQ